MKKKILFFIAPFLLLVIGNTQAQTIINSLAELKSHLSDSNGDFVMTPGTYNFNTDNCGDGKLFDDPNLLFFTGSNSTFDFTDVKFEYDTEVFTLFGNVDVLEFWTVGDNNTYLNLTMEDIGMTVPTKGASSLHIDGADNLVEGFKTTVRGSFPYGYGDMFGKGGGSVIAHQKHAGILIRGERNHVKNCTVIMRAYGHGIFVQGAEDTLIEGCYVEGELRTVGEVIQEEGTGSPADLVDFQTVWGFDLRDHVHDDTFSLQEAGIRAYSTGINYGDTESRATSNTTVKNCTMVKMRVGVNTGAEGGDNKLIENCTALACEVGFWLGHDGNVVNCRGDASVGPLFSEDIGRSNATYELTILDNYVPRLNPDEPYLFFAGTNHNFTLHDGTTSFDPNMKIQLGGTRIDHRWLAGSDSEPMTRSADNVTLNNNTNYPVIVGSNASNSTINSCGAVTNNGSSNTINQLTGCEYEHVCDNTIDNLQAECYDGMSGVLTRYLTDGTNDREVYDISAGDWVSFNAVDLTGVVSVKVMASSVKNDVAIEVRQGSETGNLLGTVSISSTSDYAIFQEFSANLDVTVNGETDIYFVAKNEAANTGSLFNIDHFNFTIDSCESASYNPFLPISAEDYCDASGITAYDLSIFNKTIGNIDNGDYLRFNNVDFGYDNIYNEFEVLASSTTAGNIELRSGTVNGALLATVTVESTGSLDTYEIFSSYTSSDITGLHDIYLVFTGTGSSFLNIDNFVFKNDECQGILYDAFSKTEGLDYCEMFGIVSIRDEFVGGIHDGDWLRFGTVDFTSTSPKNVTLNLAGLSTTTGYVNVMLDHPENGNLIATTTVPQTGAWESWQEVTIPLNQEITGTHELFIYFGNTEFNFDWFEFQGEIIELDNLALASNGAIASQSTTDYGGVASRANDGDTNGNYGGNSVSHTEHGTDGSNTLKWWQVDLGADKTINEIVIYNRTGSNYGENLNNFTVQIINDNEDISFEETYIDHPNPSFEIDAGGTVGKIIRISKTSDKAITLAEVQVFGTNTLSVNDFSLQNIMLYPNPTTNQVTIYNGVNQTLEIYNMTGVLEYRLFISEKKKVISLESLNHGVHFLKFTNDRGTTVKKLIKN